MAKLSTNFNYYFLTKKKKLNHSSQHLINFNLIKRLLLLLISLTKKKNSAKDRRKGVSFGSRLEDSFSLRGKEFGDDDRCATTIDCVENIEITAESVTFTEHVRYANNEKNYRERSELG